MALVLASAVPELRDPALGRAVSAARVHEPIDHQQRDHRVGVPVHRLEETTTTIKSAKRNSELGQRKLNLGYYTPCLNWAKPGYREVSRAAKRAL